MDDLGPPETHAPTDPFAPYLPEYRAARRLEHGQNLTATDVARRLAASDTALDDDFARQPLSVLALNVLGLRALSAGDWTTAARHAAAAAGRDHHDLLAQRIADAALCESDDLDTPTEAWLADRVCPAPFEEMETRENGDVHFCCSGWQPVPIGRIGGAENPWTSPRAAEIRRSVTEGDFSHCSRWHCPRIADRRLPRRTDALPDPGPGPKRVILSHDRSCNLACPSCRRELILGDRDASDRYWKLYETTLAPLVAVARQVKVTGSGDPFASRHFRRVLSDLTRASPSGPPRLQLQTNGLLADERAWQDLDLWGHVASVWVSVDAAYPSTYAALRGGDFERLLDNLYFLGQLRRTGWLPFLRLDMVVQQANYDEIGALVDLAQRVSADGIYLLRLRNWGTFDYATFRGLDVCDPSHPEHESLLERLRDPRLDGPGIELGSMAPLRAKALATCDVWS